MWTILNGFAAQYTKSELMAVLNEIDVPCGPVLSTAELAENEHLHAREMYIEVDHAKRGKYWTVGMPIKLSASPAVVTPAPLLGEHTDEILQQVLGYDASRIAQLRTAKAV
jgi:formyl-CoA transferase